MEGIGYEQTWTGLSPTMPIPHAPQERANQSPENPEPPLEFREQPPQREQGQVPQLLPEPDLEYDSEDEDQDDDLDWEEEARRDPRIHTLGMPYERSREPSYSPHRGTHAERELRDNEIWCHVMPRDVPPAQSPMVSRHPMAQGVQIATAWAPELAHASDVAAYITSVTHAHDSLAAAPANVQLWRDTTHLIVPRPPHLQLDNMLDLREPPSEMYQQHRVIPIMAGISTIAQVIVSRRTEVREVQTRLQNVTPWLYMSQLITIADTWFIVRMPLPLHVRQAIDLMESDLQWYEAEENRRERATGGGRGGNHGAAWHRPGDGTQ